MSDLSQVNVVMLVFVIKGCEACDDYKPRLEQQITGWQSFGVPFVWYALGSTIPPGSIPVVMIDAASEDPTIVELAEVHQIVALPSTLLLTRSGKPVKFEGTLDDQQVYDLLTQAAQANR